MYLLNSALEMNLCHLSLCRPLSRLKVLPHAGLARNVPLSIAACKGPLGEHDSPVTAVLPVVSIRSKGDPSGSEQYRHAHGAIYRYALDCFTLQNIRLTVSSSCIYVTVVYCSRMISPPACYVKFPLLPFALKLPFTPFRMPLKLPVWAFAPPPTLCSGYLIHMWRVRFV